MYFHVDIQADLSSTGWSRLKYLGLHIRWKVGIDGQNEQLSYLGTELGRSFLWNYAKRYTTRDLSRFNKQHTVTLCIIMYNYTCRCVQSYKSTCIYSTLGAKLAMIPSTFHWLIQFLLDQLETPE